MASYFSLDGNIFHASHLVSRCPRVAQAAGGVSHQWLLVGHGARLALM